jgi:hypothetical protein
MITNSLTDPLCYIYTILWVYVFYIFSSTSSFTWHVVCYLVCWCFSVGVLLSRCFGYASVVELSLSEPSELPLKLFTRSVLAINSDYSRKQHKTVCRQ